MVLKYLIILKLMKTFSLFQELKKLTDSFEWVSSANFKNFMQLARQNFDYVIIDSAPFLSVSDSSLLAQMSDVSFLTVRNGVTKPQELRLGVEISTQIGTLFDGIIYNCFEKPKG